MRIKLTLSYDGTNYSGWQVQPNAVTVQQKLEEAVKASTGETVRVTGSGRTDAGVHAVMQVAHFDTTSSIPPERFYRALNAHLPVDIKVMKSELATDDFHAVTSAKKKTYTYSFYTSEIERPLKERYAVKLDKLPDVTKMRRAAKLFVGEHDFKAFCASGSGAKTTVREIYELKISKFRNDLRITVTGNGFLYNMVRIISGTLLAVGNDEITIKDVKKMLDEGDRALGGRTLPAKGLCLMEVTY